MQKKQLKLFPGHNSKSVQMSSICDLVVNSGTVSVESVSSHVGMILHPGQSSSFVISSPYFPHQAGQSAKTFFEHVALLFSLQSSSETSSHVTILPSQSVTLCLGSASFHPLSQNSCLKFAGSKPVPMHTYLPQDVPYASGPLRSSSRAMLIVISKSATLSSTLKEFAYAK